MQDDTCLTTSVASCQRLRLWTPSVRRFASHTPKKRKTIWKMKATAEAVLRHAAPCGSVPRRTKDWRGRQTRRGFRSRSTSGDFASAAGPSRHEPTARPSANSGGWVACSSATLKVSVRLVATRHCRKWMPRLRQSGTPSRG